MCIAIFNTSTVVPVFLYNFFFVNTIFSVLGSSLLRHTVSSMLSLIDKNKDESYREQQEHKSRIFKN